MPEITISTDKSRLQMAVIHGFLSNSYWAKDRSVETIQKSIEHSLCFGVYLDNEQVGFARVMSDRTIFAYIMDVFIVEQHQGNGYSKQLMQAILDHEELRAVENWFLRTMDAQGLYAQFGFVQTEYPERTMSKRKLII